MAANQCLVLIYRPTTRISSSAGPPASRLPPFLLPDWSARGGGVADAAPASAAGQGGKNLAIVGTGRDPNPDCDGNAGMKRTAAWLKERGATAVEANKLQNLNAIGRDLQIDLPTR